MRTYGSYEDMAWANTAPPRQDLLEGWSPASIARWSDTIGFKLKELVSKAEADRTPEYQQLLTDFYQGWTEHPITQDMNVETLNLHRRQAKLLGDMAWPNASYFQGVSASLGELLAYQASRNTQPEQPDANMPNVGGAGSSMPPLTPEFGPQEEKPTGLEEPAPGEETPGEKPPGSPELPPLPGEGEEEEETPTPI
jgi:hypothetical protein